MTQKVKIKFKNMLIFVMTFALVAASVPLTGFAAAERHETQTEQETQEQEKESGTEKADRIRKADRAGTGEKAGEENSREAEETHA